MIKPWWRATNVVPDRRPTVGAMRRARMAGVLLLAVLAACGSTVPTSQRALRTSEGLTTGDGVESVAADSGTDGATGAAPGASVASGSRRGTASTVRAGGSSASAAVRSTAVGPGVTADKIFVGLSYAVNSSAANTAIGAAGITQGDTKREHEIVIEDINSHGGVAGRKIEPVWYEQDGASTASYDVIDQQMCETWTKDSQVFAAMRAGTENLLQCLRSRGVVLISDDLSSSDAARFRKYPEYIEVAMMNLDRAASLEVAALKTQGYFGGWNAVAGAPATTKPKVGIITYDGPSWDHAVDETLVPALGSAGYAPAAEDIIRVREENSTSDAGATAAAVSNAVLKLRSDNVTHVLVFDERGLITLFFTRNADSQGYRPRYGFTTRNGVQALVDSAALPTNQLIGSKGIGWLPSIDIPASVNTRNGPYSNDVRRKCLALLESKGITFSDVNAETIGMGICSSWWFFRDAVNAAGGIMNRAAFMEGVHKLGTSYLNAGNFANRFSPTQHDGVAAYRQLGFDEGCRCMKYTSGNLAVP